MNDRARNILLVVFAASILVGCALLVLQHLFFAHAEQDRVAELNEASRELVQTRYELMESRWKLKQAEEQSDMALQQLDRIVKAAQRPKSEKTSLRLVSLIGIGCDDFGALTISAYSMQTPPLPFCGEQILEFPDHR